MGLFKNEVGRPSNETLQKRRTAYIIIALVVLAVVGTGVFFTVRYFSNGEVSGKGKNALIGGCVMPYNRNNCANAKNQTVKKIQEMLKKKGFYNDTADGNFGPKTKSAVQSFQKSQGVSQDGSVGPDTLKRLCKATSTAYYEISYSANGGSGSLNYNSGYFTGAWNNTQIIINGIPTALSNGKFTKSGYNHVGYTDRATGKFYSIGQTVSSFYNQGVVLNAVYCPTGQTYSTSLKKCTGSGSTSTVTPVLTCTYNGVNVTNTTVPGGSTVTCKMTNIPSNVSTVRWYLDGAITDKPKSSGTSTYTFTTLKRTNTSYNFTMKVQASAGGTLRSVNVSVSPAKAPVLTCYYNGAINSSRIIPGGVSISCSVTGMPSNVSTVSWYQDGVYKKQTSKSNQANGTTWTLTSPSKSTSSKVKVEAKMTGYNLSTTINVAAVSSKPGGKPSNDYSYSLK